MEEEEKDEEEEQGSLLAKVGAQVATWQGRSPEEGTEREAGGTSLSATLFSAIVHRGLPSLA